MISVVLAALGDEARLGPALAALVPAAVDRLVKEVIVADAGASQGVAVLADDMGATLMGPDIGAACAAARGEWLMILPGPLRLVRGWEAEAEAVLEAGPGWSRLVAVGQGWLQAIAGGQRGAEGLLVTRTLYQAAGGWLEGAGPEGSQALLRNLGRGRGGEGRRDARGRLDRLVILTR